MQAWVEAFNRADAEALAAFYTESAINHQVAEAPVEGREAIRRMFAEGFERAQMTCIVENLLEDGEWAILEWRDPLGLRGCGFFHVRGGKIALQRGYWDKLSFLRSQGLPFELAVRAERPGDEAAIRQVHVAAFGRVQEAGLVDALRAAGAAAISEVAVVDGAVVGHVLFSPVGEGLLGLAPLAVVPAQQKRGLGAALVRRGLSRAREAGARAVVVLGEPGYYARFGFVPALRFGLRCRWPETEEAFMALELQRAALQGASGIVNYHAAFDDLENGV